MDLGARMSLVIYLQSWSESMALASSISRISPHSPPKPRFFSSSKIKREIVGFGENLFRELVPCVEVTPVSKFHLLWCRIDQIWEGEEFWEKNTFPRTSQQTMSGLSWTMSE
jgi:hypothetical protein